MSYESHFCVAESREAVKAAGEAFKSAFLMPRMASYFKFLDSSLVGREFVAGNTFTGADGSSTSLNSRASTDSGAFASVLFPRRSDFTK